MIIIMIMMIIIGSFWSSLEEAIDQCGIPGTSSLWYTNIFIPLWNFIIASITTECLGLILAIEYFIFRPKGTKVFSNWWKGGFYGLLLLTCCIITTIFCTLISLIYFVCYIIVPENQLCATVEATQKSGRLTSLSPLETDALALSVVIYCFVVCLAAFFFA